MRARSLLVPLVLALAVTPARASHESDTVYISVADSGFGWDETMQAPPGDTLRFVWISNNESPHTVSAYDGATFDSGLRMTGWYEVPYTGGTISYRCELHSTLIDGECDGMCGVISEAPAQAPPVITSPAADATLDDSIVTMTGTADAVLTRYLWVYDGDLVVGSTFVDEGSWSAEVGPLGEGAHSLVAVAYDSFGEAVPSAPLSISVADATAPGAPVVITPRNDTDLPERRVGVWIEAADTDTATTYALVDGEHRLEAEPVYDRRHFLLVHLEPGPHQIQAVADDLAGNRTWGETVTFWVDDTAPAAHILQPDRVSVQTGAFTVSGAASDERMVVGVDLEIYSHALRDRQRREATCTGCGGTSPTWQTTLILPIGVYDILAIATDRAGHAGESATVRVVVV